MTAPSTLPDDLPFRLRHFTNRQSALAAFDALWPGDGTWTLAFDGLSGNGKSTLIDFLIETRCKPSAWPWAILDFEGSRGFAFRADWLALLDALAEQWHLSQHPAYCGPRQSAWEQYQAAQRVVQIQIQQQAERRGRIEASPITIDAGPAHSQALRQANAQARAAAAAALLNAAASVYANQPLALFMDTYELMAEGSDKEYEGWLWAWLSAAAGRLPGLRVIVGSRRPLTGLNQRDRRQEELPEFDRPHSDELLQKLGVDDPAWRAAVFDRLALGHPLLTEMAANLWDEARRSGQPLPAAANIPRLAGQETAVDWLAGRILDRLVDPLKSAVRWAALLRRFDREILAEALPPDAGRLSDDEYERLRRYSFVAPARLGPGYACHNLLRRVQNAHLANNQPQAQANFHRRAAACFAARPNGRLETLYHRLMAGDEAAPEEWSKQVHAAYLRLEWPLWSALLEIVDSPELACAPPLQADAHFWRGQWHKWRYENDAALASYAAALALFRQVGAKLGEANVLLAMVPYLDESVRVFGEEISLYEAIGDRYSLARGLYYQGGWLLNQGRPDEARPVLERSRDIFISIGLPEAAAIVEKALS
ncbi:MAG: hypothetical protein JW953_01715 [Anaerolineae bacterium]|nr:hypothetical protein [Anaerolineae bacterium]